jgi:Ca-activated chloride channel homolog
MAARPSRPSFVQLSTWLIVLGLVSILIGCTRKEEPPAAVEDVKPADGAVAASRVELKKDHKVTLGVSEGEASATKQPANSAAYLDPTAPSDGTSNKMMLNLTTRNIVIYGRSRVQRSRARVALQDDLSVTAGEREQRKAVPDSAILGGAGEPTADMSAEQYQRFEDNPFKVVRGEDALSTISTAVDTASYSNVRARITEGKMPIKDAIRIADFVNYFPYDYAAPKNGDPVAFKLEMAPCPWQPKHHLLRVGLKAKVIDKDQMPPRNLVFLVDTSGSMSDANKLALVQESLRLLVEQLSGRDRVSIVTYAGEVAKLLEPTPGDQKQKIIDTVNSLVAQGSTYGEGGIRVAYEQAEKTFLKDGINRVILATDGDFNVGVSNDAELVRLIEDKRKTGVYLTVLGYGMGNLQDSKLEQLAHHGNGHYAYIDSLDEAKKLFVEQGGALVTVAKDVKLQIEFNPAKVAGYRLIGYENRILRNEDFRNDAKDAGDMGSGHTCTALYEIVPVGEKVTVRDVEPLKYQTKTELTEAAKTGEWLTVRMRYKHPETDKASEVSSVLPADGLAKEASADLRFAGAVAAFGMVLRDSEYRGDAELDKVIAWARPAIGADKGGHRAELVRLVEKTKGIGQKKGQ